MWEAVLLSITPSYATRIAKEHPVLGKQLKSYKADIDKPLSAILTLNTIAHTVGAIGVGAQAGKLFGTKSIDLGFTEISFESIIAVIMTLAILTLSEIIPKTIGANKWKQLTPFTLGSLKILIIILKPLVWLSQLITKNLKKDKLKSVLSRADFVAMAEVVAESGALEKHEYGIIDNLLRLHELHVKDIMTPRVVMVAEDENTTIEDFYQKSNPLRFSRVPVYSERTDHLTGLVLKDEILQEIIEGNGKKPLSDIKREIKVVRDNIVLPKFYNQMMQSRSHLSAVVDKFGSLVGIATMEDLVETILGLEIMDELDKVEDLQRLARLKWESRAKKLGLIAKPDENPEK
jgi:CBS domain containing-hemolysin-like protein